MWISLIMYIYITYKILIFYIYIHTYTYIYNYLNNYLELNGGLLCISLVNGDLILLFLVCQRPATCFLEAPKNIKPTKTGIVPTNIYCWKFQLKYCHFFLVDGIHPRNGIHSCATGVLDWEAPVRNSSPSQAGALISAKILSKEDCVLMHEVA